LQQNKNILCIIPARGGSKSVTKKNLRKLGDKPLVQHTIDLANSCKLFDIVCLSSDDDEILNFASIPCVPIHRPDEIASDTSPSESVIIHALDFFLNNQFDYVVLLEPTSPFRSAEDINAGINFLINSSFESVVAGIECEQHNIGYYEGGCFKPIQSKRRRQDRKLLYRETGVFYGCSVDHILNKRSLVAEEWGMFVVDPSHAVDINTESDFKIANNLWRENNGKNR
jgi:CMP-N,N'-diacetyllegionaminic acid synthase